ncbi:MAG: hypothetical protein ABIA93_07250 [Candidatus Woesearchaeota archaeon]
MAVSVKISEENYKRLCSLSGSLQEEFGRPVSLNEAMDYLWNKPKLSDVAGMWKMSDAEANKLKRDIKRGWKNWSTKSASTQTF